MPRREYISKQDIDPSLKFWFKGEQGRLVDEISGSAIVPTSSATCYWNSTHNAYEFKHTSAPQRCALCLFDFEVQERTGAGEVLVTTSRTYVNLFDWYPTRDGIFALESFRIGSGWHKVAQRWYQDGSIFKREDFVDGVFVISANYNSIVPATTKNGLQLNVGNATFSLWSDQCMKNLKLWNRCLTTEEIAAL